MTLLLIAGWVSPKLSADRRRGHDNVSGRMLSLPVSVKKLEPLCTAFPRPAFSCARAIAIAERLYGFAIKRTSDSDPWLDAG